MSLSYNISYCVSIVQVRCLGSVYAEGRDCMRERLVCMECVVKSGKTSQLIIIMYHNRANRTHKLVVAHNITTLSVMLCTVFTKAWLTTTTTTTTDLLI